MCLPSAAINRRRRATRQWILFITKSRDITPKTTEQNLIASIGKSEAEVTNSKKTALEVMHCRN